MTGPGEGDAGLGAVIQTAPESVTLDVQLVADSPTAVDSYLTEHRLVSTMSASDPLVRVSPVSDLSTLFDAGEANEPDRDGSDAASGRTDADTASEQNAPRDTLVVHAPGFGIESAIDEVESAVDEVCESAVVRVGEDPDDDPATEESVVFTDLYARYGDRETTVWSRLRDRLDAPEATVAAFVEPYELDWLCRGSASGEAPPLAGFDRVVHLRYDADDTTGDRDGNVGEAVATATDLFDEDADPKAVRTTLSAYRYSHEYEYASGVLAGETFGPALVPEVVADLLREAWPDNDSDVMERVRDRMSSLGNLGLVAGSLGEYERAHEPVVVLFGGRGRGLPEVRRRLPDRLHNALPEFVVVDQRDGRHPATRFGG